MFVVKVYHKIEKSPWALTLTKSVPEVLEMPASDWPEKKFLANQQWGAAGWLWFFLTWCRFPHRSPLLHSTLNWESFSREVSEKNVNVIAKLFAFVCVACVCVYMHWIKTSLKLSLALCFYCLLQKMVGWVAFEVSLRFMLKFKRLKIWSPMCLSKLAVIII